MGHKNILTRHDTQGKYSDWKKTFDDAIKEQCYKCLALKKHSIELKKKS